MFECLESLSEISFLYLGQAIQKEDYESVYKDICKKNAYLINSFLKIAPVVYRYNYGKLDEIKWTTSFLRAKIDMLEKYIPINNNDKINKSLKKCCNECFETLIFLREQLNEISLEKYMHLLSFA